MHSADYAVAIYLSVCPSVSLSVCLSHAGILSKRLNISSKIFHHPVATPFSFFSWLRDGDKSLIICLAASTQCLRVTDGQTDVLRQHSPRYAYASRGKNCSTNAKAVVKNTSWIFCGPQCTCKAVAFSQTCCSVSKRFVWRIKLCVYPLTLIVHSLIIYSVIKTVKTVDKTQLRYI